MLAYFALSLFVENRDFQARLFAGFRGHHAESSAAGSDADPVPRRKRLVRQRVGEGEHLLHVVADLHARLTARSVEELNRRLTEFTHVVVNFRELKRFEKSFGFADRFSPGEWELFRRWLAEGLEPQGRFGNVVVYRIPHGVPTPGTASVRTGDS